MNRYRVEKVVGKGSFGQAVVVTHVSSKVQCTLTEKQNTFAQRAALSLQTSAVPPHRSCMS